VTIRASSLGLAPPSSNGGRGEVERRNRVGGGSRRLGLAVLALMLVVIFQIEAGNFVTYSNLVAILVNTSAILMVSIFLARLLIAGAIDLSLGGVYALSAVGSAMVARASGSALLAVGAALAMGALLGAINGLLVRGLHISPIIVTLGLLAIYRGFALVLTDARSVTGLPEAFLTLGRARPFGVPLPVLVALGAFALGSFVLGRTVSGMRSYAMGGNRRAALLAGVDVERHQMWLFVHVGVAVGVVGAMTTARLGSGTPTVGSGFEIDVLTAVILGGVAFGGGQGRPLGVIVGVVTIGILNAGMIFVGIPDFYQQIAKGGVLLLALAADQWLGARREKPRLASASRAALRKEVGAELSKGTRPRIPTRVVLEAENLIKMYGPVAAVRDVSLSLRSGEVMCLVGDNGAGKSTLIRMLTGVEVPDGGVVRVEGEKVAFDSPADARRAGIEAVYQDLALCPNLGAADNLALGREPRRGALGSLSLYDRQAANFEAAKRLEELDAAFGDYLRPVADLSGGQRQAVAISRVIEEGARVVILDEPTAALGVSQSESVLRLIRNLAEGGVGVILISHDVKSVLSVADTLLVLDLGRVAYLGPAHDVTERDLIHMMAGLVPDSGPRP